MNNFSRTTVFFAALTMAGAGMAAQQAEAPAADAQAAPASTPGVAPFSSVAVTGKASVKQRYHLHPNEFLDYDYGYVLDNGQYLQMSRRVNRYYAQVRHEAKVEIYGQRPGVFKTENGTELVFTNDGADIVVTGLDKMPGGRLTLTAQPAPTAAR
jgi:hypothetical protein